MTHIENKLLGPPKSPKPKKRRLFRSWPVYCGPRWLGNIVAPDEPTSSERFAYDAMTTAGVAAGPFKSRHEAAMALAERGVS